MREYSVFTSPFAEQELVRFALSIHKDDSNSPASARLQACRIHARGITLDAVHRLAVGMSLVSLVVFACSVAPTAPSTQSTTTPFAQEARALGASTLDAPTAAPIVGFTPQVSQRNSSGVPLPYAPNAVNVVVTYTPAATGSPLPKSGLVNVEVGDNYFAPQVVRVTVGSTVEWDYNGGGGETESIHNVVGPNNAFSSGDLNPSSRFAYTFKQPGEFDYVCTYHFKQMTGKVLVFE